MSLGLFKGKRQKPITVKVKNVLPSSIKEIELIHDRGLQMAISYDDGQSPRETNNLDIAAIDLGEMHTDVSTDRPR
ncbi:hypothetical protein [Desulfosporosinus sp. FKA]|uniref:hypothetical protein n=1 Tax=Desulfosporosinus sp. FKA TaxID=1969834 RepID=UPI000B49D539|nr:hypothetical protein [Desulfosporosinus sp. FKA]